MSYINMNITFSEGIFENYLNNSKKRLKKIIKFSKGPYLTSLIFKKKPKDNNKKL